MSEINVEKYLEDQREDLKKTLRDNIEGMVESHTMAYRDRYYPSSVEEIKYDLYVNHDPSIEIERVEEYLGRELEDSEISVVEDYFNQSVLNQFR